MKLNPRICFLAKEKVFLMDLFSTAILGSQKIEKAQFINDLPPHPFPLSISFKSIFSRILAFPTSYGKIEYVWHLNSFSSKI